MKEQRDEIKVSWKGWLSLLVLCVLFSGVFQGAKGPLAAFDFSTLNGNFGSITSHVVASDGTEKDVKFTFRGKGGSGARDGFMFALTLFPTLMLALGLVSVAEECGALYAAAKIFSPIFKPLMGIPGSAGLAFAASLNSSDAASVMTKELVEKGMMTDNERTIFVAYQYAGSATVVNVLGCGAPLLPISVLPVGIIILIILAVKIMGANLVRIVVNRHAAKAGA